MIAMAGSIYDTNLMEADALLGFRVCATPQGAPRASTISVVAGAHKLAKEGYTDIEKVFMALSNKLGMHWSRGARLNPPQCD